MEQRGGKEEFSAGGETAARPVLQLPPRKVRQAAAPASFLLIKNCLRLILRACAIGQSECAAVCVSVSGLAQLP